MTRCACKGAELSCIIGNIFTEPRPPCDMCGGEAVDIYEMTLEANELDLRQADEHRQRQRLQAKALTYCKELLFFIELSQEMSFISMKSCEYWSKLALEVKYMIAAWKKRDKARV